ncbi:hypothetical protein A2875_02610 [Candidatus Gottesmanbacteria bacterium RIFCSPHIGHO2_01_FULL_46_14]|uniref:Asl1-like glycosyl hydrolase catalytic domain-containing protein n=3 Tax=Patescibacteria group TaxID=1783273 RepID=A0A1F5ZPA9_9BACT|nr:MAG: hypothetical protein UW78_C0020G0005 [Candidatus Azambacteria bacterium GW2011_GWA1_44_9]OGG14164.1 MAG: hypothetical protein A2875_02610 [Candidatus Gottesmanbacteria bacterium RIFCSPHIGHO2_01_FULL_46_14]OGG28914.1 MAG: hypothetical protein A2971_01525 [Candidatus Gottesmanbacteria bacterium RIFCSPLOWO2_01_FULL_46_21]HCR81430.1 hypothetical protein [Candidatus Paceibacterota bacterium]
MKKVVILFLFLFSTLPIYAIYDPLSVPNNKYGIHVADPQDIPDAAFLVNSNGDWGYVTVVIQANDRNTDKWQRIFDQMRRLHVIPIVRLATQPEGDTWKKPNLSDIGDWKSFLNSLNWPTENRYVVIFNEPNHAAEWGNSISPEEYTDILNTFSGEFKASSQDFFILPAGLDASAPDGPTTMDEGTFLRRMVQKQADIFSKIDGWTSHSYPNPAFSGSPLAAGRGTIRSFVWELNVLKLNLPVFITETGWQHHDGKVLDFSLLRSETVSEYIKTAAVSVWTDSRIVAVTPFILNYQDAPFDHFSWRRFGGDGFYPHYFAYKDVARVRGEPRQREGYEIITSLIPKTLVGDATTTLIGEIQNTGQGILNSDRYQLIIKDESGLFQTVAESVPTLEPGETGKIAVHITTPPQGTTYTLGAVFIKGQTEIALETTEVTLIPPPTLSIKVSAGWRSRPTIGDVTVLVYDVNEEIVHEFRGLTLSSGHISVEGLKNIVPGQPYRIVVLVPGYLPRQTTVGLDPTLTHIVMRRLLPVDFNFDGTLTIEDLPALFQTRPHDAWLRFFGP